MTNRILVGIVFLVVLGCIASATIYSPYDKQAGELLAHPDLVIDRATFEKYYPLALRYLNLPTGTDFDKFAETVSEKRAGISNARQEAISILSAPFFIPDQRLKMRLKVVQTALSAGYMDPKYGSSCSAAQFSLLQNYSYNDSAPNLI